MRKKLQTASMPLKMFKQKGKKWMENKKKKKAE